MTSKTLQRIREQMVALRSHRQYSFAPELGNYFLETRRTINRSLRAHRFLGVNELKKAVSTLLFFLEISFPDLQKHRQHPVIQHYLDLIDLIDLLILETGIRKTSYRSDKNSVEDGTAAVHPHRSAFSTR